MKKLKLKIEFLFAKRKQNNCTYLKGKSHNAQLSTRRRNHSKWEKPTAHFKLMSELRWNGLCTRLNEVQYQCDAEGILQDTTLKQNCDIFLTHIAVYFASYHLFLKL